ncbi:MAG: DUF1318 domain-containing protein [Steroidobacteraceae bacterium]
MRFATCPVSAERAPGGASPRTLRMAWILAAIGLLSGCVTVNVYFPAAAAQKAADKIINAVTGSSGNGAGQAGGAQKAPASQPPMAESAPPAHSGSLLALLAGRIVTALVPVAHAAGQADLDISTPQIRAIIADMHQRFAQLKPYFQSGVIGITSEGIIAVRDQSTVPLMQRARLAQLVAQQNRDLSDLYTQIADANGHPEWVNNIRTTFASRWIAHAKQNGWYYRNGSGTWVKG